MWPDLVRHAALNMSAEDGARLLGPKAPPEPRRRPGGHRHQAPAPRLAGAPPGGGQLGQGLRQGLHPRRWVLLGYARPDTPPPWGRFDTCRIHGRRGPESYVSEPSGHAEAIEITFDPWQTFFRKLLEFFFQIHDPTTPNVQGNDVGSSYLSAIFDLNGQEREAEEAIADVEASGLWPGQVVIEVTLAGPFWEGEPEHQDYLQRYTYGYTCHFSTAGLGVAPSE